MADPLGLVEVHQLVEVVAALRQQEVGGHEGHETADGDGDDERSECDPASGRPRPRGERLGWPRARGQHGCPAFCPMRTTPGSGIPSSETVTVRDDAAT